MISRIRSFCACFVLGTSIAALAPAAAAPGGNESGFASGGWFVLPSDGGVYGIFPQRDSKIIVGYGYPRVRLVRLLADGRPDVRYGRGGTVVVPPASCRNSCGSALMSGSTDGTLVIAQGSSLSRLLPSGRLDTSFGTGGRVTVDAGGIQALAIAPDGAVVAVLSGPGSASLTRYLPDGTLDVHFGAGGTRPISVTPPARVLVDSNGRIVVAATDIPLSRYLPDGSTDESFGAHGIVDLEGLYATALALQRDERILVAGVRARETVVVRVLSDGRLDGEFGTGGTVGHEYRVGVPSALALLPNGSVAVVGSVSQGTGYKGSGWLAAVATPAGDWSTTVGPPWDCEGIDYPYLEATAAAAQTDGKLLVGGYACQGTLVGRHAESLLMDAGAPLRLDVPHRHEPLLRAFVLSGAVHLRGIVRTSDRAQVRLSVHQSRFANPCRRSARLRLDRGTILGRRVLARSARLLESPTRATEWTRFDVVLAPDSLRASGWYSLRLDGSDTRQRFDGVRLAFVLKVPGHPDAHQKLPVRSDFVRC